MKRFPIILIALLTLVIGCTAEPDETKLLIGIGEIGKGLSNVDVTTSYYMVSIYNTDKDIDYGNKRVDGNHLEKSVAEGNTRVIVRAYNKDDIEIGNGSNTVNVRPYQNNIVRIKVDEIKGSANLNIEVDTTIKGVTFIAEIYKEYNAPAYKSVPLEAGVDGIIRGSVNLDSGFYLVRIKDTDGNYYGKIEVVKIFKDHDLLYNAYVGEDKFDVTIEIENAILPTPSITISGGKPSYSNNEAYSLTATPVNIENPSYQWFIDETPIVNGTGATVKGTVTGLKKGTHYFTVLVKNDNVQWAENHEFTFNPAN